MSEVAADSFGIAACVGPGRGVGRLNQGTTDETASAATDTSMIHPGLIRSQSLGEATRIISPTTA
ncbi:hypothetical protein GCM10007170_46580 [Arthrobacter liuii]|uniref:Uncharacterized protein n=1 Tax=Arthrobacter liuii TaxID=1476996 RepID=A0ABQ2B1C2_9MICC|nr:hypothetical protein GCM10007170_46580 [Arthrobacter liuii]